jgi:hypothetical protein
MSLLRVIQVLKDEGQIGNPYHDEHGKFTSGPHGSNLEKTGPKKGTVPGGIYQDKTTGHSYIVKEYKNPLQAGTEATTNHLYAAAGIPAAESHVVSMGEKIVGARKMYPGITEGTKEGVGKVGSELAKGYGVDAMTANWDVVGMNHDNIAIKNGIPIRIDNGGSLAFRAQGGSKNFPATEVSELKTLLDPAKNPNTAALYGKAFSADPKLQAEAMERVGKLDDKTIDDAVKRGLGAAGADQKYQDSIAGGLKARRDLILEEAKNLRTQIAKDEAAAQKKAELKAQKESEKQAAIAAGTYVAPQRDRKGKEELSVVERGNLEAALKKSDSEIRAKLTSLYEATGINRFVSGTTNKEWKEQVAKSPGIMQARAYAQAALIKQGYIKYNAETGTMEAVELHRGIGIPKNIAMRLKAGDNIDFGHLASFSEDKEESLNFAHINGDSSAIDSKTAPKNANVPVLVTSSAPAKRIVGAFRIGAGIYQGYETEKEVTLHQPHRCRVQSVEIVKGSSGGSSYIHVRGDFKG